MSKVNEINEKLIKVLEEKIQLLEEQKTINEKIIKIQKEQLFLCGVSKRYFHETYRYCKLLAEYDCPNTGVEMFLVKPERRNKVE